MAILCVCITSVVFLSVHVSSDKSMEGIPIALSISTLTNNAYATPCTSDLPTPQLVTDSDLNKTYDVIIIGSGVAGLEAAHQLHLKGIDDIVILEKNDRIGGRVWSVDYNGTCIEKGGSWIHGGVGISDVPLNPLFKIAKKYDIQTKPTDVSSAVMRDSDGKEYTDTTEDIWNDFTNYVNATTKNFTDDTLTENNLKYFVDDYYQKNYENANKTEKAMFNFTVFSYAEFDQVSETDNISVHALNVSQYFENDEEANEVIFVNGYDQIVKVLSEGLENKIKHATVTHVDYSKQPVLVTTDQDTTFKGKYVISTLPLGVMKNKTVKFNPPFESSMLDKAMAIDTLMNGTMDKYFLIFNKTQTPFWINDIDKDWIFRLPDNGNDRSWLAFFNLYKYTEQPILLAFNVGNSTIKLENEDDSTIKKDVMTVLGKMYDQTIPEPELIRTAHAKDPSFYGSYSFVSEGSHKKNFEDLAAPIGKKLFFAGEATLYDYMGTVHGAYLSGYVTAQEIQALEHKVDTPLTQSENGVPLLHVICKENYTHVIIPSKNVRVACISEASKQDLTKIWGLEKEAFKVTFPW